jgi:hypothetical protein
MNTTYELVLHGQNTVPQVWPFCKQNMQLLKKRFYVNCRAFQAAACCLFRFLKEFHKGLKTDIKMVTISGGARIFRDAGSQI